MGIVVVLMLPNPQLFPYLSDISGVNLEAVLFFNVLLNILVGVNSAISVSKSSVLTAMWN